MLQLAVRTSIALLGAGLIGGGDVAHAGANETNPLVGAWRVETYVDTPEGEAPVYAFGTEPVGMFVFTPGGDVSISIMRNPPAPDGASADPDPDACTPSWYCSYFGTYTYEPAAERWVTHVVGGNIPSFIGTDQPRKFKIVGDKLIIQDSYDAGGKTIHAERVLRRVRP